MKTTYINKARTLIKRSADLFCEVEGDNIYLSSDFWMFRLTETEYSFVAQPSTGRAAGNWAIRNGRTTPFDGTFSRLFRDTVAAAQDLPPLLSCPLYVEAANGMQDVYFSVTGNFAVFLDSRFTAALPSDVTLRTAGIYKPVLASRADKAVAVIMPCRRSARYQDAIEAFYKEMQKK